MEVGRIIDEFFVFFIISYAPFPSILGCTRWIRRDCSDYWRAILAIGFNIVRVLRGRLCSVLYEIDMVLD